MTPEKENEMLREAVEHALLVIENYEMEIRNSEEMFGFNLADRGFCQGRIYKEARERIRAKMPK